MVALDVFQSVVAKVDSEADVPDAVAQMRRLRPALFREQDYSKMTDREFERQEAAFRQGLRKSRRFEPSPEIPKGLDYSTLSPEDFDAADRYLRGASNDASVFRRVKRGGDAA